MRCCKCLVHLVSLALFFLACLTSCTMRVFSCRVDELVRRRKQTHKVTESLSIERIHSLFLTIRTRRQFLQLMSEKRRTLQQGTEGRFFVLVKDSSFSWSFYVTYVSLYIHSGLPSIVLDPTAAQSSPGLFIDTSYANRSGSSSSPTSPSPSPLSKRSGYTLAHGFGQDTASITSGRGSPGGWADRFTSYETLHTLETTSARNDSPWV